MFWSLRRYMGTWKIQTSNCFGTCGEMKIFFCDYEYNRYLFEQQIAYSHAWAMHLHRNKATIRCMITQNSFVEFNYIQHGVNVGLIRGTTNAQPKHSTYGLGVFFIIEFSVLEIRHSLAELRRQNLLRVPSFHRANSSQKCLRLWRLRYVKHPAFVQ